MTKEEELIDIIITANKIFNHVHIEPLMNGSRISFRNQNQFLEKLEEFYQKLGDFNKEHHII